MCVCVCGDGEVGLGGKSIHTTGAEVEAHLPFGRGRQNQLVPTVLPTPAFPLSIVWLVSDRSHSTGKKMTHFNTSRMEELSPGN